MIENFKKIGLLFCMAIVLVSCGSFTGDQPKEKKQKKENVEKTEPETNPKVVEEPKKVEEPKSEPPKVNPAENPPTPIEPTKPQDSGPVKVNSQFWGLPSLLTIDDKNVFLGFQNKLMIFDRDLNVLGSVELMYPIVSLVSVPKSTGRWLFVSESENVLEIFDFADGALPVKRSGVKQNGPVTFLPNEASPTSLWMIVTLPESIKMELWNTETLEPESQIDVAVKNASHILAGTNLTGPGTYFYIAQGSMIHVYDQKDLNLVSSVDLGLPVVNFQKIKLGDQYLLACILKGAQGGARLVHYLPLVADGSGFQNLGESVNFREEADSVDFFSDRTRLLLNRKSGIGVFDLMQKKEFDPAPALAALTRVAADFQSFYYLNSGEMIRLDYQMQENQLVFSPGRNVVLPLNSGWIYLLSDGSLMMMNGDKSGVPLFVFTGINSEQYQAIKLEDQLLHRFQLGEKIKEGFIFYDAEQSKFYLFNQGLVKEVKYDGGKVLGMTVLSGSLVVATDQKKIEGLAYDESKGFTPSFSYAFDSNISGVKAATDKLWVACKEKGVCVMEIKDAKVILKSVVPPQSKSGQIVYGLIGPGAKLAYFLEDTGSEFFDINIIELSGGKVLGQIKNVATTYDQFRFSSFSAGGQKFLLPTKNGLSVIDLKMPSKPKLEFEWKVGFVNSVDVTNKGKTICVSLGEGGVKCGEMR